MFSRPHHQKIAHVLQLLDHQLLLARRCFFGGGTAIALMFDEYCESVDIDFLVSDLDAYRGLRELVTNSGGVANLFKAGASESIHFGAVRADQYGIRTTLVVAGQPIKFEIVFEARIKLSPTSVKLLNAPIPAFKRNEIRLLVEVSSKDRLSCEGVGAVAIVFIAVIVCTVLVVNIFAGAGNEFI